MWDYCLVQLQQVTCYSRKIEICKELPNVFGIAGGILILGYDHWNKNTGKYHLPHIWDEILFNIYELKLE